MKYALLREKSVKFVDLRETDKYLIDDKTGFKYKKVEGDNQVASNLKFKDWAWTGDDVYNIDHPKVVEKINHIKKANFINKVKSKMEFMLKDLSYEKSIELNSMFNLEVEE